jgi:hypothetical protein
VEITLPVVRALLREALGFDSFVAGFISSVTADPKVETACIDAEGRLRYGPGFVKDRVKTREDLFCLVFHELLHPFFRHYAYGGGKLVNLACDAVINAVISSAFYQQSDAGSLFQKLYEAEGIEVILRPCGQVQNSRYARIHASLYGNRGMGSAIKMTTGEMIRSLKVLAEGVEITGIVLLGSHGGEQQRQGETVDLPAEVLDGLARELKEAVAQGNLAGRNASLCEMLTEVLKSHLSLKRRMLRDFITRSAVAKFRDFGKKQARQSSPIPISPGKRDLVLLGAGIYPVYFHNRVTQITTQRKGLAVYLDVSGSVNEHLPQIVGILRNMRNDIGSIFLFSNKVVEVPFANLVDKGQVETTYGTDFDCIAQSILEKGFEKAVILTDGYASLKEENADKLKRARVRVLTVLFGSKEDCEEFAPFGPVMQLDDVTEACGAGRAS